MTELQKDTMVQLVESGIKLSDEFLLNYSNLDLKLIRKNQMTNLKWFTKMQRSWIENSKLVIHPFIVERVSDYNEVWERLYNVWEENH